MSTLRITVEWLQGAYHGREWPPSPYRLYQAMRARLPRGVSEACALEAALRHLETLPAPDIIAPAVDAPVPVTAIVVNNDGDRALAHAAKGRPAVARAQAHRSVTPRTRGVRRVEGPLAYDWAANPETAGHVHAIERLARGVSALGHGIDVAVARASMSARPARAPGVRYRPVAGARRRLDVPWPGAFDALDARWRAERGRIGAATVLAGVREAPTRTTAYGSALELPPVRRAAFTLRTVDDRPLALEGARGCEVAAMVRHAIGVCARVAGLDRAVIAELMGHGAEHRIRVHPLPNAGVRYADGRIRRVLLTAPLGVDAEAWGEVVWRLEAAALIGERARVPLGRLAPLRGPDPVLDRFCAEARRWTTATPVVLAGYDHRRGRARPARAVRRLLRHAGIDERLLESVTMASVPDTCGSAHARCFPRPGHLARWPCRHMTLTWTTGVVGPLALGAGAGVGLGLFVPAHR